MKTSLVILHGWGSDLSKWQPLKKSLDKNKNLKVYLPLMPGFGKNDLEKPYTTKDYCDWLDNYLDKNKIKNVVLMGHSFGGQVSIQYSATHSKKVKKLILINSAGIRSRFTFKRSFFWVLAKLGNFTLSLPLLNKLKPLSRKLLYKVAREGDYYKAKPVMQKTLSLVTKESHRHHLPLITKPTLILWGAKDSITPIKDGRLINQQIKNSKLIVFPNATHGLPFQEVSKLLDHLTCFIFG